MGLIVLCGALWQIQVCDHYGVIHVARVRVTHCLIQASEFRSWPLQIQTGCRPHRTVLLVYLWRLQNPLVFLCVPHGTVLRHFDLLRRNEGVHNQRLQLQRLPEVTNHRQHVLSLALIELLDVDHLLLSFLVLVPELLQLGGQFLHLLFLRGALRLQLEVLEALLLLLLFELAFHFLLPAELPLLSLQLLLLQDGLLHDFLASAHLLLHFPQPRLHLILSFHFF
mmetsp:Transcript_2746/g.4572  ORF Transcript_2746/g.4572 Transcript_2746/m.4572 type:complete len:224 (+) Transcript_2746:401-1072(+)